MAVVAIKIWSPVAQRNEDMTACSVLLPVISFGIILTSYGDVTRNHLKRKCAYTCRIIEMLTYDGVHVIYVKWLHIIELTQHTG